MPAMPDSGPLPALWTEIEFGTRNPVFERSQGALNLVAVNRGTYYVHDLALDASTSVAYAVGRCSSYARGDPGFPKACLSVFDLREDHLLTPGTVALPASVGGDGRLLVAGDALYLHRRWAGELYILDRETLAVSETITDVYGVAFDGVEATYVVTSKGVARLGTGLWTVAGRSAGMGSGNSPVEMAASPDRVYVAGDESLQVYDASLQLLASVPLEGGMPRAMVLDPTGQRLYTGGYQGLYVLDTRTNQLSKAPVDRAGFLNLALDASGEWLYALAQRAADWFGATDVIALDIQDWREKVLYTTLSGQLQGLIVDGARDRVLVGSTDDHAMLSISLDRGEVSPRLPLGIEVVEVIAGERLYVSDSAGWIHVLDRRTYEERGRVYGGRHISLDARNGRLYAGDPRQPVVTVYDASSLDRSHEIAQPGKPRANPARGEVVIVNRRFYVFDGASGEPAGELRPGIGQPPAECPGCYYTVARDVVIDGQRGLLATITYTPWPGKAGPEESIDFDPVSGRAYYALITGGYVHYSSIATHPDLGHLEDREPPVLGLEGLAGQIALDPPARRLYVARGNVLFVLDSETLNRVGRVYTEGWTPALAAVDGELGRMYTALGSELLVWTRTGGAPPVQLAAQSTVVTNTVASIQPSPNYARDGTLLATINGRLSRTTDRGQTWQQLRGGLPVLGEYEPTVNAVFSPDYANDRKMFAGVYLGDTHGEGVYCSDDGGDTWQPCSDGLYDLRVHRVVPSPDYGQDRTLLAYARTPDGEALYRSTDEGGSWQVVVRQTSWGTPPLPRSKEMFFSLEERPPQFECDYQGTCQRSDDGGSTWTPFDTGAISLDRLVATVVSPQYAQDGTVYFMTESDLYRYQEEVQAWAACTAPVFGDRDFGQHLTSMAAAATGETTHDLFIGSAAGEFYRAAAHELPWLAIASAKAMPPVLVPTSVPCVQAIDDRLLADLQDEDAKAIARLECALSPGKETQAAFQPFQRGWMFWRQDLLRIYVLHEDGTWASYEDTWTPDQGDLSLSPPQGLYAPVRGFGRVWVLELEGPPSSFGWGTTPERGYAMVVQPYERGQLLLGADGEVYALYDDGTWKQI